MKKDVIVILIQEDATFELYIDLLYYLKGYVENFKDYCSIFELEKWIEENISNKEKEYVNNIIQENNKDIDKEEGSKEYIQKAISFFEKKEYNLVFI